MKKHYFTLQVETSGSKHSAQMAVLAAFAKRSPDGCSFKLKANQDDKDAYIAGSMSGLQLGFELAMRAIESQMSHLKIKRGLTPTTLKRVKRK